MKKLIIISFLLAGIFSLTTQAQISLKSQDAGNLIEDLMKSADVTKEQATGGAGALFEMGKESLAQKDFEEIAAAVPNMQGLLDAVPAVAGSSSLMSSAATTLTGMPKVLAIFDKLGISQDKVALFTPVIVNYVEKKAGPLLGGKLAGVFN